MKTFTYTIRDKEGVHARPAGIVVSEAKKYFSNITISMGDKSADLKRIFAVMGMCIKCNDSVQINIEGPDEEAAFEAIQRTFAQNL